MQLLPGLQSSTSPCLATRALANANSFVPRSLFTSLPLYWHIRRRRIVITLISCLYNAEHSHFWEVIFGQQRPKLSLLRTVGGRHRQRDKKLPRNRDGYSLRKFDARDYIEQHAKPAPWYLHSEGSGKKAASTH